MKTNMDPSMEIRVCPELPGKLLHAEKAHVLKEGFVLW